MTTSPADKRIDVTVAHPARRYNYWLGGKDHFAADRESGDRIAEAYPQVVTDARANRAWMHRVARCLAREHVVRQFIDVGVGLPAEPNVHEIVQRIDPTARVTYVDNDPLVMTHARALLTGTPQGAIAYAEVDMHDTAKVLAEAKAVLDFGQPVAVLYCAVLHFVEDDQQAYDLVTRTVDGLPPGSYVAISNFTLDGRMRFREIDTRRRRPAEPEPLNRRTDVSHDVVRQGPGQRDDDRLADQAGVAQAARRQPGSQHRQRGTHQHLRPAAAGRPVLPL